MVPRRTHLTTLAQGAKSSSIIKYGVPEITTETDARPSCLTQQVVLVYHIGW